MWETDWSQGGQGKAKGHSPAAFQTDLSVLSEMVWGAAGGTEDPEFCAEPCQAAERPLHFSRMDHFPLSKASDMTCLTCALLRKVRPKHQAHAARSSETLFIA